MINKKEHDLGVHNPPRGVISGRERIPIFRPQNRGKMRYPEPSRCGKSKMQKETAQLKGMGIKLINYPDWIRRGDIEKYKGLYDVNLSHVKRNHHWLEIAGLENPTLIRWGVILKNFPFVFASK